MATLETKRRCNKRWAEANPEKVKAASAKWRAANREKKRAESATYRAAHKEKMQAQSAAWCKAHPEKMAEYQRAFRERNPESSRTRREAYRATPEGALVHRTCAARRRALKRNAQGSHDRGDVEECFRVQGGRCFYCLASLVDDYHVDHMMPLSRGGSNGPENIVVSCQQCNLRKRTKTAEEFILRDLKCPVAPSTRSRTRRPGTLSR